MFEFIPKTDTGLYSDTFLNWVGVIISYDAITDLKEASEKATDFLAKRNWQINRKGLPVEASSNGHCVFVLKKEYALVIFNPNLEKDIEKIISYLDTVVSLLKVVGISSVRPYWRTDDEFKFKNTIDVNSDYVKIRGLLLSGNLLQDKDKYEIVENNISLNVEFSKNIKNNSCVLSVYALTVPMIAIDTSMETIRGLIDVVKKTRFYTISDTVLDIMNSED